MNNPADELDFEQLQAMVEPEVVEALEGPLSKLSRGVELLLFVAPGCPVCPHQVKTVAALTLASPLVAAEIVDVTREPELARQYDVAAVPTTVVDEELVVVGARPPLQMVELLLAREGPEGERAVLVSLLEAGRAEEVGERLLYGPDPETSWRAFAALWSRSGLQERVALTLAVEHAMELDADALAGMVPHLLAALEDGPLREDPARRGDTAELLGRIGHPAVRPALERLACDPDPAVAEAARAVLDELS